MYMFGDDLCMSIVIRYPYSLSDTNSDTLSGLPLEVGAPKFRQSDYLLPFISYAKFPRGRQRGLSGTHHDPCIPSSLQ